MRKILLLLLMIFFTSNIGFCELLKDEVNVFNLQEKTSYMFDVPFSVKKIENHNELVLNIIPSTSIYNEKKMLFIDAKKDGVCDVELVTEDGIYKIRFISGQVFQDNQKEITQIDLPSVLISNGDN